MLLLEMSLPPRLTLLCADSLDVSLLMSKTSAVRTKAVHQSNPHMTRGASRANKSETAVEPVKTPENHKGISYHQGSSKWEVRVGSNRTYIGRFDSQEIALRERNRALKLLADPSADATKASKDDQMFHKIRPHLSLELARRVGCVLQTHKTLDSVATRLHWLEQLLQNHMSACPFVQNLNSII